MITHVFLAWYLIVALLVALTVFLLFFISMIKDVYDEVTELRTAVDIAVLVVSCLTLGVLLGAFWPVVVLMGTIKRKNRQQA